MAFTTMSVCPPDGNAMVSASRGRPAAAGMGMHPAHTPMAIRAKIGQTEGGKAPKQISAKTVRPTRKVARVKSSPPPPSEKYGQGH